MLLWVAQSVTEYLENVFVFWQNSFVVSRGFNRPFSQPLLPCWSFREVRCCCPCSRFQCKWHQAGGPLSSMALFPFSFLVSAVRKHRALCTLKKATPRLSTLSYRLRVVQKEKATTGFTWCSWSQRLQSCCWRLHSLVWPCTKPLTLSQGKRIDGNGSQPAEMWFGGTKRFFRVWENKVG